MGGAIALETGPVATSAATPGCATGGSTLRLSASLILEDVDDATRTILGHLDDASGP
jgi:hypothetical protein